MGNLQSLLNIGQNSNNPDISNLLSTINNDKNNTTQVFHRHQASDQFSNIVMSGEDNKMRQTYNVNRIINQKTFVSSIISAQNAESLDQTKLTGIDQQSKLSLTARLDNSIVIKD